MVLFSPFLWSSTVPFRGFPDGSVVKNLPEMQEMCAEDAKVIPVSGRSPGEGNGNPLQYSCLEDPMARGYRSWGCKRVGHNLVTKQQQQYFIKGSPGGWGYRWTYLQSRNSDIDIDNKHMNTGDWERWVWVGWIGRLGLIYKCYYV